MRFFALLLIWAAGALAQAPGTRVLLDAHNCYPEGGQRTQRIERALSTGTPLAIEQDLFWYRDPKTGAGKSVVSHGDHVTGNEPSLREHFFERVRPIVEKALAADRRDDWPIIVLNLDFKTNEPEHHAEIWNLLGEYETWLTTAERVEEEGTPQPLQWKPILVLTGSSDAQKATFHDKVPVGGRLRVFGAVRVAEGATWKTAPEAIMKERATNYRRWWNNPWSVVEEGGQKAAGEWTRDDEQRLRALVKHAHQNGLWIRFYTLNGHSPLTGKKMGFRPGYNFGSLDKVMERWRAAIEAGVDFVATDMYEEFAGLPRTQQ